MKKITVLFFAALLLLGCAGCGGGGIGNASKAQEEEGQLAASGLKKNSKILFIGDSITDGGRTDYSLKTQLGMNHPRLFADYMKNNFPEESITVYNTGVSGDTLLDLYFRMKEDVFDLNPDYIVMLIGANDSWNGYKGKGVFEKTYRYILDALKTGTHAKLILMEPYLLTASEEMQKVCVIPNVNSYIPAIQEMQAVVRALGREYKLPVIYLGEVMEQMHAKGIGYEKLASDAIHPTGLGSAVILDRILVELGIKDYTPKYQFDFSGIQ